MIKNPRVLEKNKDDNLNIGSIDCFDESGNVDGIYQAMYFPNDL
jgi:hypothetical protein